MLIGLPGKIHTADASTSRRMGGLSFLILGLAAANACVASPERIHSAPAQPVRSLDQLGWAIADFDGDSQPDLAISKMETRSGGVVYWLELDLSTNRKSGSNGLNDGFPAITSSLFGLQLTPRDVDGDHNLDLVVTIGLRRRPVAVWINDGRGRFEEGDLAAYPALTPAGDLSVSAPAPAKMFPAVYDEARRLRFGLEAGTLSIRPILPSEFGVAPGSNPRIGRLAGEQAPARAPPPCV